MNEHAPTPDHDLLIEVNTNVKNLSSSLQAFTTSTSAISQDHETRIRVEEAATQQQIGSQKSIKNQLTAVVTVSAVIDIALVIYQVVKH